MYPIQKPLRRNLKKYLMATMVKSAFSVARILLLLWVVAIGNFSYSQCTITAITAGTQTICDPITNVYTQEVTVTYSAPPGTGTIDINGQSFPITGSPQTVILTNLVATDQVPVDVTAGFSDELCPFTENALFTPALDCIVSYGPGPGGLTPIDCESSVPLFLQDFTGQPAGAATFNSIVRLGECCGNDNDCIMIEFTLDEDAAGIDISLDGAGGFGSVEMWLNDCPVGTDNLQIGDPICVDDVGPHYLYFCKPGANDYFVTITSVPLPSGTGDLLVTEGCEIDLSVVGLDPATIVWNSTSPGDTSDWNGLLTGGDIPGIAGTPYGVPYLDPVGATDVTITPTPGSPSEVTYQVCGEYALPEACVTATDPWCGLSTITIFPDLFADAGPNVSICQNGTIAATLTGSAVDMLGTGPGGTAPYTFTWTGPESVVHSNIFPATPGAIATDQFDVLTVGTYTLTITDVTGCTEGISTVIVSEYVTVIESFINTLGSSVCYDIPDAINLEGYVSETFVGDWTASPNVGVFNSTAIDGTATAPANTPQTVTWTPDGITTGPVTLTLTPSNALGCPIIPASIIIDLTEFTPGALNAITSDVSCFGGSDGGIDLTVTPGTPDNFDGIDENLNTTYNPSGVTYAWDLNAAAAGTTQDLSGLTAGGVYTASVTDENGCVETVTPFTITEPLPLVVTIFGDAILCNGDADGNVTGTVTGGTAPYLVTLDQTGSTFIVGTDGASYNFTGLSALISGGFDTYSVTVTDANGSTGGCLAIAGPVNMIEPLPIVITINGDDILCNGSADGNITGTISGGTAPYSITLDETGDVLAVATDGGAYDFTGLSAAISGGFNSYNVTVTDANGTMGGCLAIAGPVAMTEPIPITINLAGDNILCFGDADGNVTGSITGGTAPYTVTLDQTGATQSVATSGGLFDFGGLSAAINGGFDTYTVTVTDANGTTGGCLEVAGPVNMIEPLPIVVTINGDAILCLGDADGNVTGTISGGTAPYTIILDQTGDTQAVATDGGSYDFSGLSSSIDGGFDTYTITLVDANGSISGCSATAGPVNMLEPSSLSLDTTISVYTGGYNVSGCADDGFIDLTVTGGVGPYTFDWDIDGTGDFDDTEDVTLLPENNYTVIVSDQNGCLASLSVFLDAPDTVHITGAVLSNYTGGVNISCNGGVDGSIDISATGGVGPYMYDWDNDGILDNDDPEDLTGIPAGTYNLIITDQNGCTGDTVVTLIEPLPLVVLAFGDDILCNGDADGNVTGVITGGTVPYTVTLDQTGATIIVATNGGNYDFSGLSAAISGGFDSYSVTVTDANGIVGGCLAMAGPVNMTEPAPIVVMINGDDILCNGDANGNVTGTISGGTAPYVITLDQIGTTLNITNDGDPYDFSGLSAAISGGFDTYSVTVTDANGFTGGCLAIAGPVNMTEPAPIVVTINGDAILCNGDANGNVTGTISGGTAPYTITLDETGSVLPVALDGGSYDFSGLNTAITGGFDNYSVTVTDANGLTAGCLEVAGPVAITEPLPLVVTILGDAILCNGDASGNVTGTISGGTAPYSITLDETGTIINIAADGDSYDFSGLSAAISGGFDNYSVTVTDANGVAAGCLEVAGPVAVTEPLPLVVTILGDAILCNGDASGNVTGTISGGTAPYSITLDETGDVLAVATDGGTYDFAGLSSAITGGFDNYSVTVTDANGVAAGCLEVAGPVAVTEPLPLVVTILGDAILCNGDASGNVTGTISGGTAPYSITLDETGDVLAVATDGGTYDFAGLSSAITGGFDNYSVTVTDANGVAAGCLEVAGPVAVTEPLPLVVTILGDAILCNGDASGNVTGTISGGTAPYSITLDETGDVLAVAADGGTYDFAGLSSAITGGFDNYSVTVTDANGVAAGCLEVAGPVAVTEPLPLVVTILGDAILCFGDGDGNITGDIVGGTAPYVITLLDAAGAVVTTLNIANDGDLYDFSGLDGLPSGGSDFYSVTVTDFNGTAGGCAIASAQVAMIEPPLLTTTTSVTSDYNTYGVSCGEILTGPIDDGGIDATPLGGTEFAIGEPYQYLWSVITPGSIPGGQEVLQNPEGLTTGTYEVLVTDANGCTITDQIIVTEPIILSLDAITPSVYAGGFNLSGCNPDGTITLTISGGITTSAYTFAWTGPNGFASSSQDLTTLTAGTYNVTVTDANGCMVTGQITLTEPSGLGQTGTSLVYPSGDNISCFGLSDGAIDITPVQGTPNYTYSWTGPGGFTAATEDITGVIAGTYALLITDANGCITDTTITLVEPTPLVQDITAAVYPSGDNISCFGFSDGSIDFTIAGGSPGYTFDWDNDGVGDNDDTEDITGLTIGTYNVIVTDINGCIIDSTITLVEPTPLVQDITAAVYPSGDNISCFGFSDGSIDFTIAGGSPGYTFDWDNDGVGDNDDTEDITGLPIGTYNVIVTDINGCIIDSTITLVEPTPLVQDITAAVYPSGDNISCFGFSDGSIDFTIAGGSPGYTFDWDNDGVGDNDDTEDITGLPIGTYNVIVTDINGCIIDSTITLVEPTPLVQDITAAVYPSGDNISCFGFSDGSIDFTIAGGSPGYTFDWDNDGVGDNDDTEDITGLPIGTYNVIVTDINGCIIDSTITLVEPTPLVQDITAAVYPSGDNISCFGFSDGSIDFTIAGGSPGYTFDWDNDGVGDNDDTEDITGLPIGTYNVIVTDINGCIIDSTITLVEPTPLVQDITAAVYPSGDNISCFGFSDGSIDFTIAGGSPGYTFDWDNDGVGDNDDTEDITGLPIGTYNVIVTDINGCIIDSTITLVEPTPLVQDITAAVYPSGDNISCFGFSDGSIDFTIAGGSPGYTFDWDNDGVGDNDDTEDITGLTIGTYNVIVTDINGCIIDSTITLVEPTPLTEETTAFVYPSGDNISCFGFNDGSIDLTNTQGSPIYTYAWTTADGSGLVATDEDQTGLTAGTYDVTTTDINGCIITSSITLVEPTLLTGISSVTSDFNGFATSCVGASDGSVTIAAADGSPAYTYIWTNIDGDIISTDQSPTGLIAGQYFVEITDINGCVLNDGISISSPPPFDITTNVLSDYNGQQISCFGAEDGNVTIDIAGGTPTYTFVWTDATGAVISNLQNPNNFGAEEYFLLATDANGCLIDTSVTLTEPTPIETVTSVTSDYNGENISCHLASDGSVLVEATGGTPGYSYSWTNSSGAVVGGNANLGGLPTGDYDVQITDVNGCIETNTIFLSQPTPVLVTIDIISDYFGLPISCAGQNDGELQGNASGGVPGYTYSWNTSPVQTTQNAINIGEGSYTVVATDINGCQTMSPVMVVEGNPLPIIDVLDPQKVCLGTEVIIESGSVGSQDCEWFFSNGTYLNGCGPTPLYFEVGCYDVNLIVTGALGCVDSLLMTDYICVDELPEADFFPDSDEGDLIDPSIEFTNTSIGATDYIWDFGDGNTSSVINPIHEFPSESHGTYVVTLIAYTEDGCPDTITKPIFIHTNIIIYVPNTFTPDDDEFNQVFLPVVYSGVDPQEYSLLIFNRWGEVVFESHDINVGWRGYYGQKNGKKCQDGTYTWKIVVGSEEDTETQILVGHVNLIR